ncbi:hypothetical protein BBOV_I001900 [Babesia bovis T2Bo]|uniref:hypothetical protein n=1 Tax=Babesia bovis T2Bo TaxID=484906 RepID=UPI001C3605ED|nr:hypothetical protein BBOV_I001900 [Babesia bovis T2Bo]EDO05274.2 hypothetical protein BBOV_I001900 [Babesia bovis T2Bo]
MTALVYALVSHGGTVIADYTALYQSGYVNNEFNVNLDAVARIQVSKLSNENGYGFRFILGHYFHYIVESDLILLCVARSNDDPELPRRFLTELRSSCTTQLLNNRNSRSELVSRILSNLVNDYNTTSEKLRSIESNLQLTTETLRHNISGCLCCV